MLICHDGNTVLCGWEGPEHFEFSFCAIDFIDSMAVVGIVQPHVLGEGLGLPWDEPVSKNKFTPGLLFMHDNDVEWIFVTRRSIFDRPLHIF